MWGDHENIKANAPGLCKAMQSLLKLNLTQRHRQNLNLSRWCMTPVPVVDPRTLLALLAAIFGTTTAATFCKLSCELLPFPTFVIGALSYTSLRVIFPAQIPHDNTRPVLHIL